MVVEGRLRHPSSLRCCVFELVPLFHPSPPIAAFWAAFVNYFVYVPFRKAFPSCKRAQRFILGIAHRPVMARAFQRPPDCTFPPPPTARCEAAGGPSYTLPLRPAAGPCCSLRATWRDAART